MDLDTLGIGMTAVLERMTSKYPLSRSSGSKCIIQGWVRLVGLKATSQLYRATGSLGVLPGGVGLRCGLYTLRSTQPALRLT